jgi:uroporphyrin-III C-methyltransferase
MATPAPAARPAEIRPPVTDPHSGSPPGPDAGTEAPPADDAPAPAAEPVAPPRRRGGGGLLLLWLLVLAALGAGGWWLWQQWLDAEQARHQAGAWQHSAERLEQQATVLRGEVEQLRERQRALEQRLADIAGGNKVMREELLGIGERAVALEDALARLAQSRREGARTLQLDEIEYLLLLAGERLQLFDDSEAAARALELAADSLAALDDPLYAGARQTLAGERALLAAQPADPRPALRGELAMLQRQLPLLPQRGDETDPAPAAEPPSRLRTLLDSLVTVRRVDDAGAALGPLERQARIGVLALQLSLAQLALETRDGEAWQAALGEAMVLFDRLFEPGSEAVHGVRRRLQALADTAVASPAPALGATLQELRNLRAARRLGRAPPAEPAPVDDEPIELEPR